ncbi:WXG100 family type VII secretion target [Actinophytocola oryzae]|uniref:WXG100 family type VII secretion target n=1 Tax=Actinophytocola oryzae TaxID=502181 RepID=A0A4R7VXW8_9PSEU|nr:WXG100 family type VII secretion target [Actinophytocola oryzae]TDV55003.1 WXG100 family type VII secretion target [Actinophytocola oryzae]
MGFGEDKVYSVVDQGHQYLDEAIRKVTGDPGELRAKADECGRCASEVGSTATSTDQIASNLGQTWRGEAYDSFNGVTTDLTKELIDVLKQNLEQEKQRLEQAAQALVSAKSQAQQQKQSFGQQAQQIIQQMQQAIKAIQGLPDPPVSQGMKMAMIAAVIMKAFMAAMQAKNSATKAADSTMQELSGTLSSLFGQSGTTSVAA